MIFFRMSSQPVDSPAPAAQVALQRGGRYIDQRSAHGVSTPNIAPGSQKHEPWDVLRNEAESIVSGPDIWRAFRVGVKTSFPSLPSSSEFRYLHASA